MTLSVHYNTLWSIQRNINISMKGVISSEEENSKTVEATQAENSPSSRQTNHARTCRPHAQSESYPLRNLRSQPRRTLRWDGGCATVSQTVGTGRNDQSLSSSFEVASSLTPSAPNEYPIRRRPVIFAAALLLKT